MTDERGGWTSASSAEADSLCPGRHWAQAGIPEESKSDDAQFGIRVHDALENGNPTLLTASELEAYEECKEVERLILEKYFGKALAAKIKPGIREHRLWITLPEAFGGHKHSGRLDVWFRHQDKALIIDYKSMRGEVPESPRNMQLRDQAILLYENIPLLSEVAVAIAQPPATQDPVVAVYGNMDIFQAKTELFKRVMASNDGKSPLIAGEVQCRYCRAKKDCSAYAAWIASQMPVEVPASPKPPTEWSADDWNFFLERAAIAAKWLNETKDIAKEILKRDPAAIPGWKLQSTGSIDTVTDPQELFSRFEKLGGKLEDYMKCLDVGKGKFKDALANTTGAKGKALESAMETLMLGIVSSKEKEPSIRRVK